jgi:hypothetical protein
MGFAARRRLVGLLVLALLLSGLPPRLAPTAAKTGAQPKPSPVTTHPRLWITAEDLPRLRGWATDDNSLWRDGLLALAEQRRAIMDAGTVPAEDTGGYGWEPYPTENYAELFAFVSLIHPDKAERADYAERARTLLMYVMNEAVKGPAAEGTPFRDPFFVAPHSNRARWWGEAYALTVDWIYPVLSAEDKATIRTVFLRWCEEIVTEGYHHPEPIGRTNDPALLADPTALRWAGNNFFTSQLRNVGLMALAFGPADDPGGELGAYLEIVVGAHLSMADHLLRTDAAGGLAPEGFEYSPQAVAYVAEFLLALHTAGQDDPERWGAHVVLTNNPFWAEIIPAYLHSLSPRTAILSDREDLGPVYLPAWYGDGENYWGPDVIGVLGILGRYDDLTGNGERLEAIRWIQTYLPPGGAAAMIPDRVATAETHREAILYFMLFDPDAPDPADPHQDLPLTHYSPGIGRLLARTEWGPDAAWFSFGLGWIAIDHQFGDGNGFSFYRDGEWLTKGLVGYGSEFGDDDPTDDYNFALSEHHNTLALENDAPFYDDPTAYYYQAWQSGSQFEYSPNGDPTILAMSVAPGYAYALGDATNLYNSSYEGPTDVLHASRSIVWLAPDVIVVYDRAASRTDGRFKRFWLNLLTEATVDGNVTTMTTESGQQLVVTTLLPSDATPEVQPLPMADDVLAIGEPMRYRLLVEAPGDPQEARFFHVLQGADAGAAVGPVVPFESDDGAFSGTVVGATAVLFPVDPGAAVDGVRYSVPAETTTHLITGLTPGAGYDVTVDSSGETVEVTIAAGTDSRADGGGVLLIGALPDSLGTSSPAFTNELIPPGSLARQATTSDESATDEESDDEATGEESTTDEETETTDSEASAEEGGAAGSGDGVIVFEATDAETGTRRIYRVDAEEGATAEDVTASLNEIGPEALDDWIAISPDGEWLLISTERFDPNCAGWPCLAVIAADLSSGEAVKIGGEVVHPEAFGAIAGSGDLIVVPGSGGPHTLDLWAIEREGDGWSEPRLLTEDSTYAFNDTAAIAAHGTSVVFNCGDEQYAGPGTAICEVGTDGSDFRVVATPGDTTADAAPDGALHHADYAPDGGIVFQSNWDGTLWRVPPDGGSPEQVSAAFPGDSSPCVLADGRIASLWSGRPDGQGLNELKVMTPDGAEYVMLVTDISIEDIGCGG